MGTRMPQKTISTHSFPRFHRSRSLCCSKARHINFQPWSSNLTGIYAEVRLYFPATNQVCYYPIFLTGWFPFHVNSYEHSFLCMPYPIARSKFNMPWDNLFYSLLPYYFPCRRVFFCEIAQFFRVWLLTSEACEQTVKSFARKQPHRTDDSFLTLSMRGLSASSHDSYLK